MTAPIVRNLTLEEKGTLARQMQIEFLRYLVHSTPTVVAAEEGVEMWCTPVEPAFFNGAFLNRSPDGEGDKSGDAVVKRVLDFLARNDRHYFMIWLDEAVDRNTWEPILHAHGLIYYAGPPCMTLDIRSLPETEILPTGFEIVQVVDIAALANFGKATGAAFSENEANTHGFVELWSGFGVAGPVEFYLGYVDDTIVASALAYFAEDAVNVNAVGTLPEYRGRGYGGAITQHIAFQARARGYRYVTLSASRMGKPVYDRLGYVAAGFADNYGSPEHV